MKVIYYKYSINSEGVKYQYSLAPILKNLCKIKDLTFRSLFKSPGEDNLFLFYMNSSTFLFVITKDHEVIKAISGNTLSHEDIYDKLNKDERLGFASYIYVGKNFYGIGSTFFGPKNSYWTHFINTLFEKLNCENYYLETSPFSVDSSKKEALSLSFKGQTTIQLNKSNPMFSQIAEVFGAGPDEANSITIEIKPGPREEMPKTFDSVTKNVSLDGVDKFIVRGREFIEDNLTNYYIVGSGHISDNITVKDEEKICSALVAKATKNRALRGAVDTYGKDNNYSKDTIQALDAYTDLGNWPCDL